MFHLILYAMKLHSPLLFVVDCLHTLLKTNISAHRPDHQAIRIFPLITYLSRIIILHIFKHIFKLCFCVKFLPDCY